jgi:hypothetical protein
VEIRYEKFIENLKINTTPKRVDVLGPVRPWQLIKTD